MYCETGIVDNYHRQINLAHNRKTRSHQMTTTAVGTPRTLLPPSCWRTCPPRNQRTLTLLSRYCMYLPHRAYTRLPQLTRQQWVFRTCRRTSCGCRDSRSNSHLTENLSLRNLHCWHCLAVKSTTWCRRAHLPLQSSTNPLTPCH